MHLTLGIICLTLMMTHASAWSQANTGASEQKSISKPIGADEAPSGKPQKGQTAENPVFDPDARRAQRLADDLKSPFCPGKTLKTCTSPNAAKVRRDIQQMVLDGMSDGDIVASLRASYDTTDFSVANPEQPAYTIFVPFIPFVILTGAMIFMIWLMRKRNQASQRISEPLPDENDAQAASRSALRERLRADDREF